MKNSEDIQNVAARLIAEKITKKNFNIHAAIHALKHYIFSSKLITILKENESEIKKMLD